ncbi:3-ketoacyl-CoA synthase 11-like [Neltuma alba]|uniref:3-ketoacyl-CoA synthase 11-like n=1 Tax=Neltuma alba TaxID=207710 RepID=UPI0010A2C088|nr:3-ketoacyl-CoA synthase 11-like [Prosopis alba]
MNQLSFLVAASAFIFIHKFNYLQSPLKLSCFCTFLLLITLAIYHHLKRKPRPVYLVDFACYKPNDSCAVTKERVLERAKTILESEQSLKLVKKILDKSGIGPKTYGCQALLETPPNESLVEARKETEAIFFGAIDKLLEKTWVQPKDMGILVVNCSVFCPTPSLCDIVVNRYKFRNNILCYNLSGMGCSAGVLAIDFAKHLLQSHPNSYAMVLSTEISAGLYKGRNPSMILPFCLFRMGGSALILSNHPSDRLRSKYQIMNTLRTHMASDDRSYNCVHQQDDEQQHIGVAISKDLMHVAGQGLKSHITFLAPLVLPLSEKFKFLVNFVGRKVFRMKIEAYVPNFKSAFEHFCIHAGGRAVLDTMQKSLVLQDWDMEPSRMTLYRFGNLSSSSVWYELAYCEAKGRIKKGDKIWQLAFGSGFKCNSAVWVALDNVDATLLKNPWMDEIHEFPVSVSSQN